MLPDESVAWAWYTIQNFSFSSPLKEQPVLEPKFNIVSVLIYVSGWEQFFFFYHISQKISYHQQLIKYDKLPLG